MIRFFLPLLFLPAIAFAGNFAADNFLANKSVEYFDPAGSGYDVKIQAPALTAGWVFTLPIGPGTANYQLITDGNGNTSWAAPPAAVTPGGSNTDVQFNNSGAFGGSSNLTWNGSQLYDGGNLELPASTATTGIYYSGSNTFLHNFAASGTTGENTFLGVGAGNLSLTGSSSGTQGSLNSCFGYESCANLTTGAQNVVVGAQDAITSGTQNVIIGEGAGSSLNVGGANVAIGYNAFRYTIGASYITAIGNLSGGGDTLGAQSTFVGFESGYGARGSNNTGFGVQALLFATGGNNTGVGYETGSNLSSGTHNILIGDNPSAAGGITTGSYNIVIGTDLTIPTNTSSNQLDIGNLIFGTGLTSGSTLSTGSVGIGVSSPSYNLDVAGTIHASSGLYGQTLQLNGSSSGHTTLSPGSTPTAHTVTLPSNVCSSGQTWTDNGSGVMSCATPAAGTVTGVSVASANGFGGSSSGGATPALTLTTSCNGVCKGNGTAISTATAGTDYAAATTGTSSQLLANNGSGGFSNVTVGTNLTFSGGTLSATGGGSFPPTYTHSVTFTSTGAFTWTVPSGVTNVGVVIVGAGGGGGGSQSNNSQPGGGGAGGSVIEAQGVAVSASAVISGYIGSGGAGGTGSGSAGNNGTNGGDSIWGMFVAKGGTGGGGAQNTTSTAHGNAGGAGFSASSQCFDYTQQTYSSLGASNGYSCGGAYAGSGSTASAGGGGGAGSVGGTATSSVTGAGGPGWTSVLTGSCYGGGGSGGGHTGLTSGATTCGGGAGSVASGSPAGNGANGTANTGGGGGGAAGNGSNVTGGTGGSGFVAIYY